MRSLLCTQFMQPSQDRGSAPAFLTRRPVQSREQQILLARQIQEWQGHPDGPENAPKLVQRRGLRAQQQLVEGNMGLVLKMARAFSGRGIDYDDLVQAGAIGLMTAARKFDPARGHAFSTYAVWWIRQALQKESRRGGTIALPIHTSELAFRALATASRLEAAQGREPSLSEVAAELGDRWTPQQLSTAVTALRRTQVVSLNTRARRAHDGDELIELVSRQQGDVSEPMEQVVAEEERERVLVCLQALDPKMAERMVAVYCQGQTLRAIAEEAGVSREAARQWVLRGKRLMRGYLEGRFPIPSAQGGRDHEEPAGRSTAGVRVPDPAGCRSVA